MSFENLNFEPKYKYTYEESYNEDNKTTKIVYSFKENYELIIYKQNKSPILIDIALIIKHKKDNKIYKYYPSNLFNTFDRIISVKEIPFKELNVEIIYYSNDFIHNNEYCIPLKKEKYNELIKEETYKKLLNF